MSNIHPNSTESHIDHESSGKGQSYRQKIVSLLKQTGDAMTDRQIQYKLGVVEKSNIQPEITRLRDRGVIEEADKTK